MLKHNFAGFLRLTVKSGIFFIQIKINSHRFFLSLPKKEREQKKYYFRNQGSN